MAKLTITPQKATEPGALDGYRVDCSECGYVGSSSLPTLARTMYVDGHVRWHQEKREVR